MFNVRVPQIPLHKSQVFTYIIGAFTLGVLIGSFVIVSNFVLLVLALVGTAILAISAYKDTFPATVQGIYYRKLGFILGVLIVIVMSGMWRSNVFRADHSRLQEFSDRMVGTQNLPVTITGYIDGPSTTSKGTTFFPFKVKDVKVPSIHIPIDERVMIYLSTADEHHYGDQLSYQGTLQAPKNFSDFDYVTYLKQQGILMTMRSPKIQSLDISLMHLSINERVKIAIYSRLFSARAALERSVNHAMDESVSGYINGILVGSREGISDETKKAFNDTGTSHILAISGYNITIIAEAVLFLLLFAMPRRKAFWVATLIIILFTLLTGASASVVRAAIMGLLLLFASGYGRLYDAGYAIIIAAGLMILSNPLILRFDIGFQLSFMAVVGLLLLQPVLKKKLQFIPERWGMQEVIATTLAAQLAVLPLLVYYFHMLSLVFLPANALVLPFVPLVMLLGFLTAIGGVLWAPLGFVIGIPTAALAHYQLAVIGWLAHLPFATLSVHIAWPVVAIAYILMGVWIW